MDGFNAPPPLSIDLSGTSQNQLWVKHKDTLELYFLSAEITASPRKKAILLYTGGEELRKIHATLNDDGNTYEATIQLLDAHFATKTNISCERHNFRKLIPEAGESIKSFVTRLREAGQNCEFEDYSLDAAIIDQVIEKTTSSKLRRMLLMKEKLTLESLLKTASTMEVTEEQAKAIEGDRNETESVNAIKHKFKTSRNTELTASGSSSYKGNYSNYKKDAMSNYRRDEMTNQRKDSNNISRAPWKCYGCGDPNHGIGSRNCPALGHECKICGAKNHFESTCRRRELGKEKFKKGAYVKNMQDMNLDEDSDDEYVFNVGNKCQADIRLKVEENNVDFLTDSGATVNLIDRTTFDNISAKAKLTLYPTNTKIYTYGAKEAIKLDGIIFANIRHKGIQHLTRIHVTSESKSGCILGRKSAIELGLLKMSEHINSLQSGNIKDQVKSEFPELFEGLGKLKNVEIKLNVDCKVEPVSQHLRRVPFHVRKKVEKKLNYMLEQDVIEKVTGSTTWVSPIVAVPKGDEIRLTIDMRQPNRAIKRSHYPVPTLDEILQQFNNCKLFTKIDLNNGYHQISLHPDSRELTTFITHQGLFRFKRLVQGANSAFEEYQRCIANLFQNEELIANICDDILVAGKSESEHDKNLRTCLNILKKNNLTINEQKCIWKAKEVNFYGHIISENGIKPTESKVAAVNAFPSPKGPKEVSSFLGLVTYLARFIPNLASETAPLRSLLCKDVEWKWGEKEEETFIKLKNLVTSSQVVAHFNPELDTGIIVDAGKCGLGAILVQTQKDKTIRPVQYASRTLSKQECRYSQTEKEALSVIYACEKFHMFLYGKEFEIITDHQPLTVLYSHSGKPSPRILRWGLRLQSYDYRIKYIPGKLNPADMLSINPIPMTKEDKHASEATEKYINSIISYSIPKAVSISEILKESEEDETIKEVIECLNSNEWVKKESINPYYQNKTELMEKGGILTKDGRIVIPKLLRKRILSLAHESHMGIVKTKALMKEKCWWPGMNQDIENMIKSCIPCLSMGNTVKEPMGFIDFPMSGAWEQVHIDLCGPYPTGEYVLGIIDASTRWPELYIIKSTSSKSIIKCLKRSFSCHGYPEKIVTDNAQNLISAEIREFCEENGITHKKATAYWPQGNSEIERFYKTLGKFIKTSHSEGRRWQEELDSFLLIYRNTPHSTTSVSPAKLLMNRDLKDKIPTLKNEESPLLKKIRKINAEKKLKAKENYDRKFSVKESDIKVGDWVLVRRITKNKLSTNFETNPVKVLRKYGPMVTITVNGRETTRNVKDVKKVPNRETNMNENLQFEMGNLEENQENRVYESDFEEEEVERNAEDLGEERRAEPVQENVNVENNVVEREHFVRRSTRTTKAPERYGDPVVTQNE